MKRKAFKKTLFITIFVLGFTFHASLVFAQQVGLSISPAHLEAVIKPGKSILIAYTLENFGDPAILKTKVLPFIPRDNFGNVKIKEEFEGPVRFSLDNANITFDQPFFLKTKESQQLLLRIRIPEGAPEGDYYYTFLAETQPFPHIEGVTSSRAQARIGSNILLTVTESGRVDIKGKIALFDVLPRYRLGSFRLFDSADKIPIVLIVQNNGKNMIKPEGEIVLMGNFGEKASYEILSENILAESQRQLTATGSADIQKPVTLFLSGFFLGNYKLSTGISFGEGSPKIFASTSFIALPIKFFAGLLGVILTSIVIVRLVKRS